MRITIEKDNEYFISCFKMGILICGIVYEDNEICKILSFIFIFIIVIHSHTKKSGLGYWVGVYTQTQYPHPKLYLIPKKIVY